MSFGICVNFYAEINEKNLTFRCMQTIIYLTTNNIIGGFMATEMKKCYIYTRVSTAIQTDGYSLDAQERRMQEYAEYNKLKIVGKYSDEGRSGKSVEGRPAFLQMMDDIESHKDDVSYVLVFKLSRFGRNAKDVLVNLEAMQANDVNLICVEDGIDSSKDAGKLIISVLASVAEIERENIAAQTFAGRIEKATKGLWNGGKAPYGYNLVKGTGKLEVKEEEAEIVRIIFEKFISEGLTPDKISKYLNEHYKRIPIQKHDKNLFTANFVRHILDNETYCGYIVYGKTRSVQDKKDRSKVSRVKNTEYIKVPGTHTPLITTEQWNVAHKKREETKTLHKINKNRYTDHTYPLSGLIVCPDCGCKMNGYSSSKKNKNKGGMYKPTYAYKCRNNKIQRGYSCDFNRQLNEDAMCEAIVAIISRIASNEKFERLISEKIGASIDVSDLQKQKSDLEKNYRSTSRAIEKLGYELDTLDFDDELYDIKYDDLNGRRFNAMRRLADLQKEIEKIECQIMTIKESQLTRDNIYTILLNFDRFFSKFDIEEKKQCLHAMIESIEIRNDLGEGKSGKIDYSKVITAVKFKFPISIKEDELTDIYLTNENTDETVVLLSQRRADEHIDIKLDLTKLDITAAETKPTYDEIKDYVFKEFGMKVSSLYISQVKRKLGLEVGESYNKPKSPDAKQPQCPKEKEKAIVEALKWFKVI